MTKPVANTQTVVQALLEAGYITEASSKQALFLSTYVRDARAEFRRQMAIDQPRSAVQYEIVFDEPVQYEKKSERFVIEARASKQTDLMCEKLKTVTESAVKSIRALSWPHYKVIHVRFVYLPDRDIYGEEKENYTLVCLYNYYEI